jgi:hypothetical protein
MIVVVIIPYHCVLVAVSNKVSYLRDLTFIPGFTTDSNMPWENKNISLEHTIEENDNFLVLTENLQNIQMW